MTGRAGIINPYTIYTRAAAAWTTESFILRLRRDGKKGCGRPT